MKAFIGLLTLPGFFLHWVTSSCRAVASRFTYVSISVIGMAESFVKSLSGLSKVGKFFGGFALSFFFFLDDAFSTPARLGASAFPITILPPCMLMISDAREGVGGDAAGVP